MLKSHIIFRILVGVLTLSPIIVAAQVDSIWQSHYDNILVHLKNSDYDKAIPLLGIAKEYLELNKTNYEFDSTYILTINDLGVCYSQTGYYNKGYLYYKQALALHENCDTKYSYSHAETSYNLGKAYQRRNEHHKAIQSFKYAQALLSSLDILDSKIIKSITNGLIRSYKTTGQSDKALSELKKEPKYSIIIDAGHYLQLGRLYKSLDSLDQAISAFEEAREIAYCKINDEIDTINQLDTYLNSQVGLVRVYIKKGDYKLAKDLNEEIINYTKNSYLGIEHHVYHEALSDKVNINVYLENYLEAFTINDLVIENIVNYYGINHGCYTTALRNKVYISSKLGYSYSMYPLAVESVHMSKNKYGFYSKKYLVSIRSLTDILITLGRFEEASHFIEEGNQIVDSLFEYYSIESARNYRSNAYYYHELRDYDSAEKNYIQSLNFV